MEVGLITYLVSLFINIVSVIFYVNRIAWISVLMLFGSFIPLAVLPINDVKWLIIYVIHYIVFVLFVIDNPWLKKLILKWFPIEQKMEDKRQDKKMNAMLKGTVPFSHDWVKYVWLDFMNTNIFPEMYITAICKRLEDVEAFNHAAIAFLDVEFIEAFGKLKTIQEDEKLRATWNTLATKDQRDLVLVPIALAMNNFKTRFDEYDEIVVKTKLNELNSVLTQDVHKIHEVKSPNLLPSYNQDDDFSYFLEGKPSD